MISDHEPGVWVASHHLFLQVLSLHLQFVNPALVAKMRASLIATMAAGDETMKECAKLALNLCDEDPH